MNRSATIDPANIHQVNEFKHPNPLTTLKADPTGRFVAAGAQDLDIQLWNLNDGHLETLTGHKSWVRSIVCKEVVCELGAGLAERERVDVVVMGAVYALSLAQYYV